MKEQCDEHGIGKKLERGDILETRGCAGKEGWVYERVQRRRR